MPVGLLFLACLLACCLLTSRTANCICFLSPQALAEFPFFHAVYRIAFEGADPHVITQLPPVKAGKL
jgi:hypothetical protein